MSTEQKQAYESERARRIVVSTVHKAKGLGWERVYVSASAGIFPSDRSKTEEETEEEIRVFYVAATRAKLEAIFTYAEKISGKVGGPSSYLTDYVEPFTAKGLELPRVDGWTILSVSDPVRYERQRDGELVEATLAEDGMWSIWLVDVAGPKVLLNLVTESELSAALQEALKVQDEPNAPMPIKPEPVKAKSKSKSKLSEEDERFLQYLTHMQGEASPGLSWATIADSLRSNGQLRSSILNEVRNLVRQFAAVEQSPEVVINRVLGPTEVLERKAVWVTLPAYPMSQDRPGVGSLVADGRWVSVTRPWSTNYPALLLTGSTLICDFPTPSGTEWVAYRVSEGGTPEAMHRVSTKPGGSKNLITEFHEVVSKIKQEIWSQDQLQAWMSERSFSDQLMADARYLYESAASRPIRVNASGRVEVVDADYSSQGKLVVRVLTAADQSTLARLVDAGFLRPDKDAWHLNVGPFEAPAPPKIKISEASVTAAPVVEAKPKKKRKST